MPPDPTPPSAFGIAMRDLARLREVATAVATHGFGELLIDTPLARKAFGGASPPGEAAGLEKELSRIHTRRCRPSHAGSALAVT